MHRSFLAMLMLGGLAFSSAAAVETFRPQMDNVAWQFSGDHFACTLALPITNFGEVRFVRYAGEPLTLVVEPSIHLSSTKDIALSWHNPPWLTPLQSPRYDSTGKLPLNFGEAESKALLEAMDKGLWGKVSFPAEIVELPSVKWQQAATAFRHCLDVLAPMSYRQARDMSLFYASGARALTLEQRQQLRSLSRYVALDKGVDKVLVDAFTDDTGDHLANLQLARERAADVKAALLEAGMSAKLIQTRAHGDRYPSTNNQTAQAREQNRRVTIRVIRNRLGKR
ncbi:OmpA family protein [Gallaecimonas pentaromativorans]|uniref:OmpA family protein n=2 Tax=Gallaecimonas pentaromativorans TaxID=584787 RepID=A0A3N1PG62_9GAMM|nr:OmpA family protein [Gallaecimonas pentaromativorans]